MKKITSTIVFLITISLLSSCGGNSSNSNNYNNTSSQYLNNTAITIDNSGTVPLLNGYSTSSVIYVHNNTNQLISNITYTAHSNYSSGTNTFTLTNSQTCKEIAAYSSCPLSFNTPNLTEYILQGAALITANYNVGKTNHSFNQIINYAWVPNNSNNGAIFNSAAQISQFGNHVGYATIYLYGSGTNQNYTVTNLISNTPGVTISQGNITGKTLQSNFVQAVEISSPIMKNTNTAGFNTTLTATSSSLITLSKASKIAQTPTTYTSVTNINVASDTNQAILVASLIPLINSSAANPSGTMYIVNTGSSSATTAGVNADDQITISNNTCDNNLDIGSTCTIEFGVPQDSGSGIITLNYTDIHTRSLSVAQNVIWFNHVGAPLLAMSINPQSLYLNTHSTESAIVTITNIGGYNLESITIPAPQINGHVTTSISNLVCQNGGFSLPIGKSCSYSITLSDNTAEANQLILQVNGSYTESRNTKTYTRFALLPYSVTQYAPFLIINTSAGDMQIVGNGIESQTQTITVTNDGSAPAIIDLNNSSFSLNPAIPALVTSTPTNFNTCTNPLNPGTSCILNAKLESIITTHLKLGSATYLLTYTGGDLQDPSMVSTSFNYTVLPQVSLRVQSVIVNNNHSGGDGVSSDTPYIFSGATTTPQNVIFTLINDGNNPLTITNILDTNSLYAWSINSNSSCLPGYSLESGDTCTLEYNWNLSGLNATAGNIGAVYTANIVMPNFTVIDTTVNNSQFQIQPDLPTPYTNTTLYAEGNQATLTNTISKSITNGSELVHITHTLANAHDYAPVTVTSHMENYFSNVHELSPSCSQNSANGITSQTCTLTPDSSGDGAESASYVVSTTLLQSIESLGINVLFSETPTSNQTISMSPVSSTLPLITCATNHHVYTMSSNDDIISMYMYCSQGVLLPLNPATVRLPSGTQYNPSHRMIIDPSKRFMYVSNVLHSNISMFKIESKTGVLTGLGTIATGGPYPTHMAIAPSGQYLYLLIPNYSIIETYKIESTTGLLTSLNPFAETAVPPGAQTLTIDPSGKYLYETNFVLYGEDEEDTSNVAMFAIESTSGALSPLSPATTGVTGIPLQFIVTAKPDARYFYIPSYARLTNTFNLSTYQMDPMTGILQLSNIKNNVNISVASRMVSDPQGKYIYSTTDSSHVELFNLNPNTGELNSMGYTPSYRIFNNNDITFDEDGKYAYIPSGNGISIYEVDQNTGLFTPLSIEPSVISDAYPTRIIFR